jgi:hypothetical protein
MSSYAPLNSLEQNMTATDAAPTQNYKLRQIMLSFSYLAYSGQDITTPNPENKIRQLISDTMPKIVPIRAPNPEWAITWGPGVFTMPGALYQDNMMFVANNVADPSQYVIAIRGTNFISDLDWLMEDLDILQMMPWPKATNANISESTSIDLQVLLGMTGYVPGGTPSLLKFLNDVTTSQGPINLCVTGHSLGGCVAGPLALYLKENRGLWDNSKHQQSAVCCITFAAPTAGNQQFATYSNSQFAGPSSFPGWDNTLNSSLDAVRCTLDVAPLGWIPANFAAGVPYPPVLTKYESDSQDTNLDFWNASGGAALSLVLTQVIYPYLAPIMNPTNYQQVVANATPLTGTFQGPLPAYDASLTTFVDAFIKEARYQHSSSYPVILGVPALNTVIPTRRSRRLDAPTA